MRGTILYVSLKHAHPGVNMKSFFLIAVLQEYKYNVFTECVTTVTFYFFKISVAVMMGYPIQHVECFVPSKHLLII